MSPSSQGWRKQKKIPLGFGNLASFCYLEEDTVHVCGCTHTWSSSLPQAAALGMLTGCSCQSLAMPELTTATAPAAPSP